MISRSVPQMPTDCVWTRMLPSSLGGSGISLRATEPCLPGMTVTARTGPPHRTRSAAGASFFTSEIAPGGRKLPDAEAAADLLGGHAHGFGEGGKRELHLGKLLDVHSRAHRGRDDLDGLRGVLAEHVS